MDARAKYFRNVCLRTNVHDLGREQRRSSAVATMLIDQTQEKTCYNDFFTTTELILFNDNIFIIF